MEAGDPRGSHAGSLGSAHGASLQAAGCRSEPESTAPEKDGSSLVRAVRDRVWWAHPREGSTFGPSREPPAPASATAVSAEGGSGNSRRVAAVRASGTSEAVCIL